VTNFNVYVIRILRDSSVLKVTGYGLDAQVYISNRVRNSRLKHSDQGGPAAHPVRNPVGTSGKATGG
jgi:hypothetical protein